MALRLVYQAVQAVSIPVIGLGGIRTVEDALEFLEETRIPRICFYHLVYAGRGSELVKDDLTHEETRRAVDVIIERTKDLHDRGIEKEVLTVDNHVDGPYLYLKLLAEDPGRAEEALDETGDDQERAVAVGDGVELAGVQAGEDGLDPGGGDGVGAHGREGVREPTRAR